MIPVVQSESMTPIESALVWKCKVCGYRWLIEDKSKQPKRCARSSCKSILWNRNPKPVGRPRIKRDATKGKKHKKGK